MVRVVAFIPVRGGSKSTPKKNIKVIAGKPLVHWSIAAALKCEAIDDVYVSTDDPEIKDVVNQIVNNKLHVINRSEQTATDTATTESAMIEFANNIEFDHIVLIQATSPLTTAQDLTRAINVFQASDADSILSVVRQKRFIWDDNGLYARPSNYEYTNRPRRQDFKGFLVENGAFYITSKEQLLKTQCRLSGNILTYEMPEKTYYELDEMDDWSIIECLLKKQKKQSLSIRLKNIKVLATDVDGVLTDAGMYYANDGEELKKFNTKDGKGIELVRRQGIAVAIITSEKTNIVARRAKKLRVENLYQGVQNKMHIIEELVRRYNISIDEICYIGDDLNDLDVLKHVGFSACPYDAILEVKNSVNFVCENNGGGGCVREVCDLIVAQAKNKTK